MTHAYLHVLSNFEVSLRVWLFLSNRRLLMDLFCGRKRILDRIMCLVLSPEICDRNGSRSLILQGKYYIYPCLACFNSLLFVVCYILADEPAIYADR